jgi:transposase-like protein
LIRSAESHQCNSLERTMNKRRRLGEAVWRELTARFSASGLSASAFCAREKISPQSLYRWRSKLAQAADAPVVRTAVPVARPASGFLDLGNMSAPAPAPARIELRLDLGGGVILQIARH